MFSFIPEYPCWFRRLPSVDSFSLCFSHPYTISFPCEPGNEKKIPHILGNSERSGAKSYLTNEPPHIWWKYSSISSYIRKPFLIVYDFAPNPIWISLYVYEDNFAFFLSVWRCGEDHRKSQLTELPVMSQMLGLWHRAQTFTNFTSFQFGI